MSAGIRPPTPLINQPDRPAALIACHAEQAATRDGRAISGSRTAPFHRAVAVPLQVPPSGRTPDFGSQGPCRSGCTPPQPSK